MAPAISDDEISETESERSLRDPYEAYHDFEKEHSRLSEKQRRVNIVLRDGHDIHGKGMTVEVPYLSSFKNVFDHFKDRSCTNCRCHKEMRFKMDGQVVAKEDTPKGLDLTHGTTTEIKVWSNAPGLQCRDCQRKGYPNTTGVHKTLHARTPLLPSTPRNKQPTITLKVKDLTGYEMLVRMLSTTPFSYLMKQYTDAVVRERRLCRFCFDEEILVGDETPKQMGIKDEDLIEVRFETFGGGPPS